MLIDEIKVFVGNMSLIVDELTKFQDQLSRLRTLLFSEHVLSDANVEQLIQLSVNNISAYDIASQLLLHVKGSTNPNSFALFLSALKDMKYTELYETLVEKSKHITQRSSSVNSQLSQSKLGTKLLYNINNARPSSMYFSSCVSHTSSFSMTWPMTSNEWCSAWTDVEWPSTGECKKTTSSDHPPPPEYPPPPSQKERDTKTTIHSITANANINEQNISKDTRHVYQKLHNRTSKSLDYQISVVPKHRPKLPQRVTNFKAIENNCVQRDRHTYHTVQYNSSFIESIYSIPTNNKPVPIRHINPDYVDNVYHRHVPIRHASPDSIDSMYVASTISRHTPAGLISSPGSLDTLDTFISSLDINNDDAINTSYSSKQYINLNIDGTNIKNPTHVFWEGDPRESLQFGEIETKKLDKMKRTIFFWLNWESSTL